MTGKAKQEVPVVFIEKLRLWSQVDLREPGCMGPRDEGSEVRDRVVAGMPKERLELGNDSHRKSPLD